MNSLLLATLFKFAIANGFRVGIQGDIVIWEVDFTDSIVCTFNIKGLDKKQFAFIPEWWGKKVKLNGKITKKFLTELSIEDIRGNSDLLDMLLLSNQGG